jgi:hypothetical protein
MERLSFDPNGIQRQTVSQRSTQQSEKSNGEKLELANLTAKKIISCFPDYGKAPKEYLLNLVAVLADYPEDVQEALADRKTGIPSKVQFLPTIAVIVEMADTLMAAKAKAARFDRIKARAVVRDDRPRFTPFPALAVAFADEPELLVNKRFEQLYDASQALATDSKDKARTILSTRHPQPGDAKS